MTTSSTAHSDTVLMCAVISHACVSQTLRNIRLSVNKTLKKLDVQIIPFILFGKIKLTNWLVLIPLVKITNYQTNKSLNS